jgi:hypothetical protein
MKLLRIFACLLLFIAALSSTSTAADESPVTTTTSTETNGIHKGTVISTFDEDGYTYIKYQDSNSTSWVAVLQLPVREKEIIEFPDNQPLLNYQSRTLKEPFDKIIFATDIKVSEPAKPATNTAEVTKSDNVTIPTPIVESVDKAIVTVTEEVKAETAPVQKEEAQKSDFHLGKVISSVNTNGYTYIEYEENELVSWVAVPEIAVKPGEIIEFPNAQLIKNFGSKSLKKNFNRLYMVSVLRIVPQEN